MGNHVWPRYPYFDIQQIHDVFGARERDASLKSHYYMSVTIGPLMGLWTFVYLKMRIWTAKFASTTRHC